MHRIAAVSPGITVLLGMMTAGAVLAAQGPRVVVEGLDERSHTSTELADRVRDAVARDGTLTALPAAESAKALSEAQDRWLAAMAGIRPACEYKTDSRFPYVLRAKLNGLSRTKELALTLLSGEVSCSLASVTVPFNPADPDTDVRAGLAKVLAKLPHKVDTPFAPTPATANLPEMVTVPAGTFLRGCNEQLDPSCDQHEAPHRTVTVDRFEIDSTEVTVDAYAVCIEAGKCTTIANFSSTCNWGVPDRGRHPINCVSWDQARDYCAFVGKRLPTEAEWEKAARGSDGRVYPWGNEPGTCERAVLDENGTNGCGRGPGTWPVGSKPAGASPYGALDMAGNVAEWVADWYDGQYYAAAPERNPGGPKAGAMRVFRGGGYFNQARELRTSHRERNSPGMRNGALGFRCAKSP